VLRPETRKAMGEVAVKGAKAVDYVGAGTFEFLLDPDGNFYFLEMNTRLQVEHPITEWVTGIDLVRQQILVACGEKLAFRQEDLVQRGASVECRIYAEDPDKGFLPSPGLISSLRTPAGPGVRDDSGIFAGYTVPMFYDPLLAKLSVWAEDRTAARARMHRALGEYHVGGIRNNVAWHRRVMRHPAFQAGQYDTGFIERYKAELGPPPADSAQVAEARQAAVVATAVEALAQVEATTNASAAATGGDRSAWGESARWRK
jgi:acetyl-CoA carboxylase biotin carboxylase subunit